MNATTQLDGLRPDQNASTSHAVARIPPPSVQELALYKINQASWSLLVNTLYPEATDPTIVLALLEFCQRRGYDPFRRPVHLVSQWNKNSNKMDLTIWPGINSIRSDAAVTGAYAGLDRPEWGPDVTKIFRGRVKEWVNKREVYNDVEVTQTFPEWCIVTVYRFVAGQKCAFPYQVFWEENYQTRGVKGSTLPNDMWTGRGRGQLQKCAEAGALRAAFPEISDYTAEEMEGRNPAPVTIDGVAEPTHDQPRRNDAETGSSGPAAAFRQSAPPPQAATPPAQAGTPPVAATPAQTFTPPAQQRQSAPPPPMAQRTYDVDPNTGEVLNRDPAAPGPLHVPLPKNEKGGVSWTLWIDSMRAKLTDCASVVSVKQAQDDNADSLVRLKAKSEPAWLSFIDACGERVRVLGMGHAPPAPLDDDVPF